MFHFFENVFSDFLTNVLFFLLGDGGGSSGDDASDLGLDLVQSGLNLLQNGVDGGLVVQVNLGDTEDGDPGEDDEGHGVEPGADVGQEPEAGAELDGLEHVLDQEETSQLGEAEVELAADAAGEAVDLVLGDLPVAAGEFSDGVDNVGLLEEVLHDVEVDFDTDHGSQDEKTSVGDDADDAVVAHRDEREQDGGEDRAGGQRVLPQVKVLETHDEP